MEDELKIPDVECVVTLRLAASVYEKVCTQAFKDGLTVDAWIQVLFHHHAWCLDTSVYPDEALEELSDEEGEYEEPSSA